MGSALWAGISGLNASAKQMDVIANNIANVNTIGYKAGKTYFADVLSQSVSGGASGSMQVGRGVKVSDIGTSFGAGSFETTGSATDLAIDGDGFFILDDDSGASYYTRAGAFHINADGNLVNSMGYKLQGESGDIILSGVQSAPESTATFSIGANLDVGTATGDTFTTTQTVYDTLGDNHNLRVTLQKTEDPEMWGFKCALDGTNATTQTYYGLEFDNTTGALSKVYSSALGAVTETTAGTGTVSATTINNYGQLYKSTAAGQIPMVLARGATNGTWTVAAGSDGGYDNISVSGATVGVTDYVYVDLDGAGGADITFTLANAWAQNDTINIASITQTAVAPASNAITFAALPSGATIGAANVVTWDMALATSLPITDYASTSVINSLSNDGYSSGDLKSLSISADGVVGGFFTNGQTADIAQLVLATFPDITGLQRMGSNLFGETLLSGAALPGNPGAGGLGTIASNSLEMSNTDIATEFINMITAQKSYSANARVITAQDQMMTELINIKR